MINIKAFCRAIKEKFQARSRRRRMFADAMFLIRLQQMDASVVGYIQELEAKVADQAREIKLNTLKIQNLRMVAVDADLDGTNQRFTRMVGYRGRIAVKTPPLKTILAIATLLTGCVFSAPESGPGFQTQTLATGDLGRCRPSCVLLWKYVDTIPLAPNDTDRYVDQVGRTRLSYEGILEDGREAVFTKARFDTLKVGDTLAGCKVDPAIVCQEQP